MSDKGWMGPLERIRIDREMAELTETAKEVAKELKSLMGELAVEQKERMHPLLASIEQVCDCATSERDNTQTEGETDALEETVPVV